MSYNPYITPVETETPILAGLPELGVRFIGLVREIAIDGNQMRDQLIHMLREEIQRLNAVLADLKAAARD